jgi:hypothetical protein
MYVGMMSCVSEGSHMSKGIPHVYRIPMNTKTICYVVVKSQYVLLWSPNREEVWILIWNEWATGCVAAV